MIVRNAENLRLFLCLLRYYIVYRIVRFYKLDCFMLDLKVAVKGL